MQKNRHDSYRQTRHMHKQMDRQTGRSETCDLAMGSVSLNYTRMVSMEEKKGCEETMSSSPAASPCNLMASLSPPTQQAAQPAFDASSSHPMLLGTGHHGHHPAVRCRTNPALSLPQIDMSHRHHLAAAMTSGDTGPAQALLAQRAISAEAAG